MPSKGATLIAVLVLGAGNILAQTAAVPVPAGYRPPADSTAPEPIMAISHRGEHLRHPENTIPAFQEAIADGADYIEVDVQTTKDGKLVLMHDNTVNRTTAGKGKIADLTFDEIQALDPGAKFGPQFAGTRVPTFDEALDLAHGKINVYVDTKNADAKQLVDTIVRHDMQDHVVIYSNPFFSAEVQKIRPDIKIMPESDSLDVCRLITRRLNPAVLAFGGGDFKPEIIDCAKKSHALIYVDRMGNTDNPAGWQQAIDMGADGIQTDKPKELVEFLRSINRSTHPVTAANSK